MGQVSGVAVSCGVGQRKDLDPTLLWLWLWLWHRPVATAPNPPLACELPYATGAALKRQKRQKKKKNKCILEGFFILKR